MFHEIIRERGKRKKSLKAAIKKQRGGFTNIWSRKGLQTVGQIGKEYLVYWQFMDYELEWSSLWHTVASFAWDEVHIAT